MDFTRAQTGREFRGLGVLPPMNPARANIISVPSEDPPYDLEDADGYVPCLTEVVDWPFSEDDAGVAFDQENLYGVRTRVWRRPMADGGGDKEWWTAVPKTLPGGYTACGRCHIGYAQVFDYLGDDPSIGISWNHRTANGALFDGTTPEDIYRARWSPMNLNQRVLTSSISSVSWSAVGYPPFGPLDFWYVAALASEHIGFRGGKLVITSTNPSGMLAPNNIEIIGASVLDTYDDAVVLDSHSVDIGPYTSGPPIQQDITLSEILPSSDGIPWNFWVRYDRGAGQSPTGAGQNHDFQLSPRTDVPLPWFASQKNRVAPGGIILP